MQKNKNIPIDHSDRWELFLQRMCIKFLSMKLYVFLCFTPAVARGNSPRQLTSGYDPTKLIPAAKRGDPRSYLVRRDSVTGNLCHFPWCARGWVCAQSDERMLYTSHTHTYCEFHECRFVPEFSSRFFHLPDNVQLYYAIYRCTWGEFITQFIGVLGENFNRAFAPPLCPYSRFYTKFVAYIVVP